jgi:D-xylose transport system substrate-binding protein
MLFLMDKDQSVLIIIKPHKTRIMKSKISFIAYAIVMVLLMSSCSSKDPKVGLMMGTLKQERWTKDTTHFANSIRELDGQVIIKNANNNQGKQIEQAKELIEQGVNVLVVVPVNQDAASKIVELAHENDIKVIAYDRLIRNAELDYYVSFDNVKIGERQAEYLTKVQPEGNYALIGGPTSDNNSIMLRLGQMNVLSPLVQKGDIKVIYDKFAESWNKEAGKKAMRKCLREHSTEIDAVIAGNDALAEGISEVIEQHGMEEDILLAGQDAELDACQRIIKGSQTMTIYKPVRRLAEVASKVAAKFASGEEIETLNVETVYNNKTMVPSILLTPVTVHEQNIKMTVLASGYQEEEKIFK